MTFASTVFAQTPNPPTTPPAQPGTQPPPKPALLGRPGFTNSNAVIAGFTNAFGVGTVTNQFTNQFDTVSVGNLAPALSSLQLQIEQVLPFLFAITSGADISGLPGVTNLPPPVSQSGANFGANFGVNASQNFSANATQPSTAAAGASTPPTAPPSTLSGSFLAPTGTTNALGGRSPFAGSGGTNTSGLSPDAMQLISILQNDLQRALPLLSILNNALSGGTATNGGFVMPTNVLSGTFVNPLSNRFVHPLTNQSRLGAPQ